MHVGTVNDTQTLHQMIEFVLELMIVDHIEENHLATKFD